MVRDGRRLSGLLGVVGLILAAGAGGALLPGSAPVATPEVRITPTDPTPGSPTDPVTGDRASGTSLPSTPSTSSPTLPTPQTDPGPSSAVPPEDSSTAQGPPASSTTRPRTSGKPGTSSTPARTSSSSVGMPAIGPSPVLHLRVPAIGVDADVLPVDSQPTGEVNQWGGTIYRQIDFPVDQYVRQWVRRGDPNSLPADRSVGDVKAFDRVVLYGHASDIGNHLVFQDLSSLHPGDAIVARTALGTFTYRVTMIATRAKAQLDSLPALYDYPKNGAKEIALVACLPDTTSNVVVIGALVSARPAG
jgi:hypothetical protein